MDRDHKSWVYQKRSSPQSCNLDCASIPSDPSGQHMTFPMKFPIYANSYACMDSASSIVPGYPVSQFPQGWNINYTPETCPPTTMKPIYEVGNHMSLISAIHPSQVPSSTSMRIFDGHGDCEESMTNTQPVIPESIKKSSWCRFDENYEPDVQSSYLNEMHEDTEEIDALLCSDGEDDETSTGHSPCDMMQYQRNEVDDSADIITSPATPTKRRRLNIVHDPSLMDTASSGKAWEYEDDTESSCSIKVADPSIDSKQLKKKRIREKMGILRTMLPGGKGKHAAVVLDETIRCLKSLKLKTKALGATATKQHQ